MSRPYWILLSHRHHVQPSLSGNGLSASKYRLHKVHIQTLRGPCPLTCVARYWGKRDVPRILPTNSSLSVTLDQDHLSATTTARADPSFVEDTLWLNGTKEVIKPGGRTAVCIEELRRLRAVAEGADRELPKARSLSSMK
jgi:diphosphomevalonate decarboxylase